MAGRARRNAHKLLILRLHFIGKALLVAAAHIFHQALKGHMMDIAAAELRLVMHRHLLTAGAVQNDIPDLRAQLPERRIQAEVIGL